MQITSEEIFLRKHLTSRKALWIAIFLKMEILPFGKKIFFGGLWGGLLRFGSQPVL